MNRISASATSRRKHQAGLGSTLVFGAITLVAFAGAPASAQCPWNLASAGVPTVPGDPPIRQNHAAAFDSVRNQVVVMGGFFSGFGFYGDTWTWNGTAWTLASTTGPSARGNHAMAFDASRGKVVLFGGANPAFGDTWEWDGTTWTQVFPVASPQARFNHAMAYDSVRNLVVLTGGFSTVRHNDTWEYNGVTWTQRTEAGFTNYVGRNGHGMDFDASRNRMVIFGGFGGSPLRRLEDTWEMGATGWSQSAALGPTGRQYLGGLAYDPNQHLIYLFGGQVGGASQDRANDLWTYNGTVWTQVFAGSIAPNPVAPGTPYRRDQHTTTYDRGRQKLVIFGGYQGVGLGGTVGDTWTTSCTTVCYANCDGSTGTPLLTANDFTCFINAYANGQSYANCDGSTGTPLLTGNDFLCFINAYAGGCT